MKKSLAISLMTLLLFSCGGDRTSSENVDSSSSSEIASSMSSSRSSSMESSASKSQTPSSESDISSSDDFSEEESSLSASSEEKGVSSSPSSSTSEWNGKLNISAEDIPATTSGQYLIDETFTTQEGYAFLVNYVQRGSGRYSEDYIQMRKFDEVDTSYIQSQSILGGTILIAANRNYNSYGQIDMTACPTVYCSSSPDERGEAIQMEAASSNDETTDIYLYQGKGNGYFTIANETNYALYLSYISWNN